MLVRLDALLVGTHPTILALAAVGTLIAGGPPSSDFQPEFDAVLLHDLGFSSGDLADLEREKSSSTYCRQGPQRKSAWSALCASVVHAIACIAAYRDIVTFRKTANPPVLEIGRFSERLDPSDLDALTTDDFDLRGCRVGDCDIRLPTAEIQRVGASVDWRRPGAEARASAFFKQLLLTHVRSVHDRRTGTITEYQTMAGRRSCRRSPETS